MLITKEFKFHAAHHLPNYHGECENVHGHTYRLKVTLEGEPRADGMIIDFVLMKKIVDEHVLSQLDHKDLNGVVENPSAENIVLWIWQELSTKFPRNVKLYEIKLWETETSSVTYNG